VTKACTLAFKAPDQAVVLIGETQGHLGASTYLAVIEGREDGAPPPVDLAAERRNGDFVRGLIEAGRVDACHDLSDGGLAVAVAEMALAGRIGATIDMPPEDPDAAIPPAHAWLFGEDQARYIVTVSDAAPILRNAAEAGVPAAVIGTTGGEALTLSGGHTISLDVLSKAHEAWLPDYMGAGP
jgi:phosphoribosylformylglycinamidine synthase